MNIRSYKAGDEKAIVELWNICLTKDPINPARFRILILLDANFDPEGLIIAEKNNRVIGCLYAVRRKIPMYKLDLEPENGWITFFFVNPENEKQDVASLMLEKAENFLSKTSVKNVFFSSYAPNYILPGIDFKNYSSGFDFLKKSGFQILYSPVAMDYNLLDFHYSAEVKNMKEQRRAEGFTFSEITDGDLYECINFANEKFNPDWGRAIREGILQGLPMSRILIIRSPEKNIVGFCMYSAYEGIPERFGPFGVDTDQRGKGLGKILFYDCLYKMRGEGLHGAWFLWTGETTPAGYLYKKTGFKITRQFHVMKKCLLK